MAGAAASHRPLPRCRAEIGPYLLLAELAGGLALAVVAAPRVLGLGAGGAGLGLVLLAVPLAFIDVAVRRLPDPLATAAFAGALALGSST